MRKLDLKALRVLAFVFFVALSAAALAQEDFGEKSLGDAAREQRQLRRQSSAELKLYKETGTPSSQAVPDGASVATAKPRPDPSAKPLFGVESVPLQGKSGKDAVPASRSALDRPKEEDDSDFLIVPAGTKVSVEVPANLEYPATGYAGRVSVPVRVGFATAIPALSPATVQVVAQNRPEEARRSGSAYFETVELTQVIVEGVPYALHAKPAVKLGTNTSASEATFTLVDPLRIPR